MKRLITEFLDSSTSGGILLFIGVVVSLLIANSSLYLPFTELLTIPLGIQTDDIDLNFSLALWINDGLMAIFFLLVGLEIKREIVDGELSSPRKAVLPILCAIGGAIIPALIYMLLNQATPTAGGWGIPMATDIAFALALITMLGNRVPASLKIFLAALAIVDDLMAILVIAFFYSTDLHTQYLLYAAGILMLLIIFNRLRIQSLFFYLIPGLLMWYFIHHSGIHATIAGVLTALTIPVSGKVNQISPLERLEHFLAKPVNFIIIPLFAIANTNIRFEEGMLEGLTSSLGLGIILGLLIGKPLGILLVSGLSVRLGLTQLPQGASCRHMLGLGLLAGIGFTMSIFISLLSFTDSHLIQEAKFSILTGSLLAGLLGYMLLKSTPLTLDQR